MVSRHADDKDERVQYLSETLDLTPETIVRAYEGENYAVLCQAFSVAKRESDKTGEAAVATAVALPVTVALYQNGYDLWGGLCLAVTVLAAFGYHQGSQGVQACRRDVLAHYAQKPPPAP